MVFLQEADGNLIGSGSIESSFVFNSEDSGNGSSGFAFGLDAAQQASLNVAVGALGGWAANPDIRIGAAAGIGADATGSPERIFVFNRVDAFGVPESSTYVLAALGLIVLGFWHRRRSSGST
ncbi:MAG: hypothetical protein GY953_44385 [bacterium]|nr:hypothetical protein [bacterium]